ncbi:putative quorum-sensing-regulated virulence factor [Paludisphaera mucosa]|uniref:DUF3820 family protein n=1 Tax=Paludisphaera mucosa TaxID=3030827 RepID=A0ABT6FLS1_9BACT|nr:DUF3820 family protein [Paludisphaera mucosa]MDG3008532.1 DUF3820 family protein [Paludisphaera mucosa]
MPCRCPKCGASLRVELDTPRDDRPKGGQTPPRPMTDGRAADFQMPFGKHKGRTLAQIADVDRDYLTWLADNVEPGSVQRAVRHFLQITSREAG